jgi:signal peptidase II
MLFSASSAKQNEKKWNSEKVSARIIAHSKEEKRLLIFCSALVFFFLLLDQGSKLTTRATMELGQSITLIPGWFNLTYVHNPGAAWSLLAGFPWLLLTFGVIAGICIILFFRRWCEGYPERYWALAFIESGILGNSIDRLWYGSVIDFFHVHYYDVYHYPIFNIADCAICVGVILFICSNLFRKTEKSTAETE